MKRLLTFAVCCAAVCAMCAACESKQTAQTPKTYKTYTVIAADRTLKTGYTATIHGCQTVEIRPQVSGMITDIFINEGDFVRKDSILFIIDQTPYKTAYEIAAANVKSAEAALSTAQLMLESNRDLFKENVISEVDLMTARNDLAEAEARLALCRAEEENARINLSYTEVRSPVNGVASMIPYRVGALVSSNITEPLVTVSDDSEVYAYFSMAENKMLDLIQQYGSLQNAIKDMPEVELTMSNGKTYGSTGRINAISGTINGSTGAVSLRAAFPNRNRLLREGGSGTVVIPSVRENCIVIPQSATYELQDRIFVYKVVEGRAVATRIEVMDRNNGVEYIVEKGLRVGDIIVAEGAGLIREGTEIIPQTDDDKEETGEAGENAGEQKAEEK